MTASGRSVMLGFPEMRRGSLTLVTRPSTVAPTGIRVLPLTTIAWVIFPFQGKITQAIVVNGNTLIPVGATVEGRVTRVSEPRRISGKPSITLLPEAVIFPTGERYYLDATLTDTN